MKATIKAFFLSLFNKERCGHTRWRQVKWNEDDVPMVETKCLDCEWRDRGPVHGALWAEKDVNRWHTNGFTIIELMIVVAIIGIAIAIVVPMFTGQKSPGTVIRTSVGTVSEQCLSGYKFIVSRQGAVQQILNERGGGVRCDN